MLRNMTKGISPFIKKSIMSFEMAQFIENIGVLMEYNRNPITLLNLSVKCINCKWRGVRGTCDRPVNEGL